MADYKKMYYKLHARVADAVELLITAQREVEEDFLSSEDAVIRILEREEPED